MTHTRQTTLSRAAATTAARALLDNRISLDALLAKLPAKDRQSVERHVAALEAEGKPAHLRAWKRLACDLGTLASHAVKTTGQHALQFYIPDGKYRMQVFALQDQRDGTLVVYAGNVLKTAIAAGILRAPARGEAEHAFRISQSDDSLEIEEMDGQTPNPLPFYKDMLGWNRKAIRIAFPAAASTAQLDAAERLCTLAACDWITP